MRANKKLVSHHEWQVTVESRNENITLLFISKQRLLYVKGWLGSARGSDLAASSPDF